MSQVTAAPTDNPVSQPSSVPSKDPNEPGEPISECLSFRQRDQFFHAMLSYRVMSEGPFKSHEEGGNNLSSLIYDACSACNMICTSNNQSLTFIEHFGTWPKAFPTTKSSSIRLFLDTKNLRTGCDWKGTGKREDGGFLGALSSSLLFVPLLSARPARFQIQRTEEKGRYKFLRPINIAIPTDGKLEIFRDAGTDAANQLSYKCTNFRLDSSGCHSFMLKSTADISTVEEDEEKMLSNAHFWTPECILPQDGSGPRGSVSQMLTIMQSVEELDFLVVEQQLSQKKAVLKVVQLSDHVFFQGEEILLKLQEKEAAVRIKICSINVQGSKCAFIESKIVVECGEHSNLFAENKSFHGQTDGTADRVDNVLLEFMLARALNLALRSDSNPHPCKFIMPVFVDSISSVKDRLSNQVSKKTESEVKSSLAKILNRDISESETKNWIRVSVKGAVHFMTSNQGLQLYSEVNRLKAMNTKAELVCSSIVSTIGIEAEQYCLEFYESNNPVAHELLDFINHQSIGHIGPSLVTSGVTSVKIFSQLSSESIKLIAKHSQEVSKKPLIREISDIEIAVQAAKVSPFVFPVSERLAKFHDDDASFMTIAYSTFAMEQILLKPFFGKYLLSLLGVFFSILCAYQFYQNELIFAYVNLPRGTGLCAMWICGNVLKDIQVGRMVMFMSFLAQGLACIAAVIVVDKFENGAIEWDESSFCSTNYNPSKLSICVLYLYLYYFWQSIFYILMAVFILWRQEFCWRCWNVCCSVQNVLNLVFQINLGSPSWFEYVGVVFFPILLFGTEGLKFYGTQHAIWSMRNSKSLLSKEWAKITGLTNEQEMDKTCGVQSDQDIKKQVTNKETLSKLVDLLNDRCKGNLFVIDRSKDLGKWKAGCVEAPPPIIHQPTCNFDELYDRALVFNDIFQQWIESFFIHKGNPGRFIYIVDKKHAKSDQAIFMMPKNMQNQPGNQAQEKHERSLPFQGQAIRGPVKRPSRAIAKVHLRMRFYHQSF
jgi:hypothetical protein